MTSILEAEGTRNYLMTMHVRGFLTDAEYREAIRAVYASIGGVSIGKHACTVRPIDGI